jgi:uncharacterized membrane protein
MSIKASTYRLQYIDWMRGFGALIMLQGHAFDSFLKTELRPNAPYMISQFFGGMPPAIFLFLTGITLAFLMDSSERKGLTPRERVIKAFGRSRYLFFLAFAFRAQLFITGFPAPWRDLFRVDILNCMGFAIAALSVMALFRTADRVPYCAAVGLGIAFLSPVVAQMNWEPVPWILRDYIVPDHRYFGFFPWGAYLAFGMSAGSMIRAIPKDAIDRAMQWTALAGGAMILACQYFGSLPYSLYAKSEFWLDSPAQVLSKQGVTLLMLSLAFLWTRYGAAEGWSPVRQFGTTSLLVYWVHIELVYGRGMWFFKGNLTATQTVLAAILVILIMLGLSVIRTNWDRVKPVLQQYRVPLLRRAENL